MRYLCNILRAHTIAFLNIVSRSLTQHPFEVLWLEAWTRLTASEHSDILYTKYFTLLDVANGMHTPARKLEQFFFDRKHAFHGAAQCCFCLADTGNHFCEFVPLDSELMVRPRQAVLDSEVLLDDIAAARYHCDRVDYCFARMIGEADRDAELFA